MARKKTRTAGPVVERVTIRPGQGWEQRCYECGGKHTSGYSVSDQGGTRFYCEGHYAALGR